MTTPRAAAHDAALADLDAAYCTLKAAEADRRARRITHDEMLEASLAYDAALETCCIATTRASKLSAV